MKFIFCKKGKLFYSSSTITVLTRLISLRYIRYMAQPHFQNTSLISGVVIRHPSYIMTKMKDDLLSISPKVMFNKYVHYMISRIFLKKFFMKTTVINPIL